jgi:uncharacterized protein (TIGR03663 family)
MNAQAGSVQAPPGRAGPAAGWILFLTAAALRLPALGLRPLHHDEGSNVIFILRLIREGRYQYDPTNYHGPLLFYASAVPFLLFGERTWVLRLIPALLGGALAPLCWSLRRILGRDAAATGAILLAVSPALVYYARDAIHETYLVFLTLAMVAAAARALETRRLPAAALAGLAAGGVVATKETFVIVFAALAVGAAAAAPARRKREAGDPEGRVVPLLLLATAVALIVVAAFYTRGFREPAGIEGPIESVRSWGGRAVGGDGHTKPWWYFLSLLAREEWAILLPALAGVALTIRRRRGADRFLLGWSGATLAAYSTLPYKTPWLLLNPLVPMALLGGRGLSSLAAGGGSRRRLVKALLALLVLASAISAVRLSFVHYDDDSEPLVYVQTKRQALALVRRLEETARRDPDGKGLRIDIVSPDYLPLNWYLREFTNVAYHGHLVEPLQGAAVIARTDQAAEVRAILGPDVQEEEFDLRPGVRLILFLPASRGLEAPPAAG